MAKVVSTGVSHMCDNSILQVLIKMCNYLKGDRNIKLID